MMNKYEKFLRDGYSLQDAKRCVGIGWHGLLKRAYEFKPEETIITQVKEKFGGLRIYSHNTTDEYLDLLEEIESESYCICENCGDAGELREHKGWWKTVCDECAFE